jgi:hypothetical protein
MINELESYLNLSSPIRHLRSSNSSQSLNQSYLNPTLPSNLSWDHHHQSSNLEIDPIWDTSLEYSFTPSASTTNGITSPSNLLDYPSPSHHDQGEGMAIDLDDFENSTGKRVRTRLQSSKYQQSVSISSSYSSSTYYTSSITVSFS